MNKEMIEKMYDEQVSWMIIYDENWDEITDTIKYFIFDTIIPEVLESVIYSENEMKMFKMVNEKQFLWLKFYDENLKQKVKELYWINL